jgi:hypothetical protein
MQGPSERGHDLTCPVAASAWWATQAATYREIATEASAAAARAWDRGDHRGCEVAITVAEDGLRWCEACAAFAEAYETQAWAAVANECGTGLGDYAATTEHAREARASVELARDACREAVAVRRLALMLPDCTGETLCAGTDQTVAK